MSQKPVLSSWEKATVFFVLFKVLLVGLCNFVLAPIRGGNTTKKTKNHVMLAMLRALSDNANGKQLSWIQPTTHETYLAFAKERAFEPKWETLPSGLRAYWIGNSKADKTMIFFYGGGYSVPIGPGYFPSLSLLVSQKSDLSILVPAFTLSWMATYPTQLREGVETLSYVLSTLQKPPSQVSVAGDSAGANLAMGILSHLLHPHPEISAVRLEDPLGAAVLVSPWVTFSTDCDSVRKNWRKDMLTECMLQRHGQVFLGKREKNAWNEPLRGSVDWWAGLNTVVKEVLVTVGTDEILLDYIKQLGERLQSNHPRVTIAVAEGEWHDNFCMQIPLDEIGTSKDAIMAFCNSRL